MIWLKQLTRIKCFLAGKYKAPTESPILTKKSKDKWTVHFSRASKTCEKVALTLWPPVHKILRPICSSGKHFYGFILQSEAHEKGLKLIY